MTSIFPADAATHVFSGITGMITSNIAPILILLGLTAGIGLALFLFNSYAVEQFFEYRSDRKKDRDL